MIRSSKRKSKKTPPDTNVPTATAASQPPAASKRTNQATHDVLRPPPNLVFVFNFQSKKKVLHHLYDNRDDRQRDKHPNERTSIELFDRILVVGKCKQQFWYGIVANVEDDDSNILLVHWDHESHYAPHRDSYVSAFHCVIIPYPHEEGTGRIGIYYQQDMIDDHDADANKKPRAKP